MSLFKYRIVKPWGSDSHGGEGEEGGCPVPASLLTLSSETRNGREFCGGTSLCVRNHGGRRVWARRGQYPRVLVMGPQVLRGTGLLSAVIGRKAKAWSCPKAADSSA